MGERNLYWLANAMTRPLSHFNERYFYDVIRKDFFYVLGVSGNINGLKIFDAYDMPYPRDTESDIAVRLELSQDDNDNIIEIPRLDVFKKIDIQMRFLYTISESTFYNDLKALVEQQTDDFMFVMDKVLVQKVDIYPILNLWEDYKLKFIFNFVNLFAKAYGMEIILAILS